VKAARRTCFPTRCERFAPQLDVIAATVARSADQVVRRQLDSRPPSPAAEQRVEWVALIVQHHRVGLF